MFIRYRSVNLGLGCNFRCIDCSYEHRAQRGACLEDLEMHLLSVPRGQSVAFAGGEPFAHNCMESVIRLARERFGRVKYATNGSCLADADYLKSMISAGARIFEVRFFTVVEEIHNFITGTDSFQSVKAGVGNLASHLRRVRAGCGADWDCRFYFGVRVMVNSLTIGSLAYTVKYLCAQKPSRILLDFRRATRFSEEDRQVLEECLRSALDSGTWIAALGLPPCGLRGLEEHCGDAYRMDRFIPGYDFIPGLCEHCILQSRCAGAPDSLRRSWSWFPLSGNMDSERLEGIVKLHAHIPEIAYQA